VSAVRQFHPLNCAGCGGVGHDINNCSSARGVTIHDDGTSAPATGVNRTLRFVDEVDASGPRSRGTRGTTRQRRTNEPRAPPTVWTEELGPCRIKRNGVACGKKHLHRDCPLRKAALEEKKSKTAGVSAVYELHNDADDSIEYLLPDPTAVELKADSLDHDHADAASNGPVAVTNHTELGVSFVLFVLLAVVIALCVTPSSAPEMSSTSVMVVRGSCVSIGSMPGGSYFNTAVTIILALATPADATIARYADIDVDCLSDGNGTYANTTLLALALAAAAGAAYNRALAANQLAMQMLETCTGPPPHTHLHGMRDVVDNAWNAAEVALGVAVDADLDAHDRPTLIVPPARAFGAARQWRDVHRALFLVVVFGHLLQPAYGSPATEIPVPASAYIHETGTADYVYHSPAYLVILAVISGIVSGCVLLAGNAVSRALRPVHRAVACNAPTDQDQYVFVPYSKKNNSIVKSHGGRYDPLRSSWVVPSYLDSHSRAAILAVFEPISIPDVRRSTSTRSPAIDTGASRSTAPTPDSIHRRRAPPFAVPVRALAFASIITPVEATPMINVLFGTERALPVAVLVALCLCAALVQSLRSAGLTTAIARVVDLATEFTRARSRDAMLDLESFMHAARNGHRYAQGAYVAASAVLLMASVVVPVCAGCAARTCVVAIASVVAMCTVAIRSPDSRPMTGSAITCAAQAALIVLALLRIVEPLAVLSLMPILVVYYAAAHAAFRRTPPLGVGVYTAVILLVLGITVATVAAPTPHIEPLDTPAPPASVTDILQPYTSLPCRLAANISPIVAVSFCQPELSDELRAQDRRRGDYVSYMHDNGAGQRSISPFLRDFAAFTSHRPIAFGGIGSGTVISPKRGRVDMLALDTHDHPYVYSMHDVMFAPRANGRIFAAEPERLADNHLDTKTMTQQRADGSAIPFTVSSSHYWTDGIVLRPGQPVELPPVSLCPPSLLNVDRKLVDSAIARGGGYVYPEHDPRYQAPAPTKAPTRTSPAKKRGRRSRQPAPSPTKSPAKKRGSSSPAPAAPTTSPAEKRGSSPPADVPVAAVSPEPDPQPASTPTTIPIADWFGGIGCAPRHLRRSFHPVAYFDADDTARGVFTRRFPDCPTHGDFQSVAAGSGPGTFVHAAKQARVGFASPPCSDISTVNDSRSESSSSAQLIVDTVRMLPRVRHEVLVIESTPTVASARAGHLLSSVIDAAADVGYTPTLVHADPTRIGGSQSRCRMYIVLVRDDVAAERGAFSPVLARTTSTAVPMRQLLDPAADVDKSLVSDAPWFPSGITHSASYRGPRLEFTASTNNRQLRAYHADGPCPTITSDPVYIHDDRLSPPAVRQLSVPELVRMQGLEDRAVDDLPDARANRLIGRGTEGHTMRAVGAAVFDYIGASPIPDPLAPSTRGRITQRPAAHLRNIRDTSFADVPLRLAHGRCALSNINSMRQMGFKVPTTYFSPEQHTARARHKQRASTGITIGDGDAVFDYKGRFCPGKDGAHTSVLAFKHPASGHVQEYYLTSQTVADAYESFVKYQDLMRVRFGVVIDHVYMDRDTSFNKRFRTLLRKHDCDSTMAGANDHYPVGTVESYWLRWEGDVTSILVLNKLDRTWWKFVRYEVTCNGWYLQRRL
jgi:site-specific DNA-cytosine methylase